VLLPHNTHPALEGSHAFQGIFSENSFQKFPTNNKFEEISMRGNDLSGKTYGYMTVIRDSLQRTSKLQKRGTKPS